MEFLWFFIGLLLGGCVGFTCFACLQVAKISDLEDEIRRIRNQLKHK